MIPVGSRWRWTKTGKVAVVVRPELYGIGVAWRWETEPEGTKPHYSNEAEWLVFGHWEAANEEKDGVQQKF